MRFNLIGFHLSFQTRGSEVEPLCIFLKTFVSNVSHSLIVFVCLFVFSHVVTCSKLFYCCVVSVVLAVNLDRPAVKTRNRARGMGWNRANTNLV